MAANVSPIFALTPINKGTQFTISDTTAKKSVLVAGANGSLVEGIVISTNDTTAVDLAFYINDGTTDFYLGVVHVPIGSGYTSVARVDGLAVLTPPDGPFVLQATYTLKAACVATMTTAKTTDLLVIAGNY